jgi:hypothetical protein
MATVIDSLLVTLGLDAKPFKKGADEAARAQKQLRDNTQKTSNEIVEGIARVGRAATLLFLGFEGIKGAINYFAGLNAAEADLGRLAKSLGLTAHEVNAWGTAISLNGGKANEFGGDLQQLSSAITGLYTSGAQSPLTDMLRRAGVALKDARGNTRDLTDILNQYGAYLRQFDQATAFNLGKQAGLSDSTVRFLLQDEATRTRLLKLAEQQNAVNDESVKKAQALQEQWRLIGLQITGAGQKILSAITPVVQGLFDNFKTIFTLLSKAADYLQPLLSILNKIGNAISPLINPLAALAKILHIGHDKDIADAITTAPTVSATGTASGTIDRRPRGIRNNNPGNLRVYPGYTGPQENGFRIFATPQEGYDALRAQLRLNYGRGFNTINSAIPQYLGNDAKNNNIPAYIQDVIKRTGVSGSAQLTTAQLEAVAQAITQHEGNGALLASYGPNPNALRAAQFATAQATTGAAQAAPGGGGNSATTSVQIDEIVINTQATDATGIADALPAALKRKGVVAQADSGMS